MPFRINKGSKQQLDLLKEISSDTRGAMRLDLLVLDSLTHNYRVEEWENWKERCKHLELCLHRLRDIAIHHNAAVVITSEMPDDVFGNMNSRLEANHVISGGWIVEGLTDLTLFLYRSEHGRVCRLTRPGWGETDFSITDSGFSDPDDEVSDGEERPESMQPEPVSHPNFVVLAPGVVLMEREREEPDENDHVEGDDEEFDKYF